MEVPGWAGSARWVCDADDGSQYAQGAGRNSLTEQPHDNSLKRSLAAH